ncbi:MAG: methenyltetrahydromethanopterin cyclohydrolase [Planctomycetia bacterium]|nr:methenyltetrahydromethanopterin cyclohydrolase [Planctomycetia bacterium]
MNLNQGAQALCQRLLADIDRFHGAISTVAGATVIDLGINAPGGHDAGLALAEVCLAGLARVEIVQPSEPHAWPFVAVSTDHPVAACMASQYAGWQIAIGQYFAMGSGPMRAVAAKEELFARIGCRETADEVVGVLETRKIPTPEVIDYIAKACRVAPERLTLLVAPTASPAGTLQIVARSVETALHKLLELGFDLSRVERGTGTAPLPPVAADDMAAIGRTNDAILYGGEATLSVRGDDASLEAIGPRVPSSASPDHGQPFAAIFERYNRDFYKIDPLLFSPAVLAFRNLDTGYQHSFGHARPDVLAESFHS